jgi:hypoxanthine phosphoribosyltransferase
MRDERRALHKIISVVSPFIPSFEVLDLSHIGKYSRSLSKKVSVEYNPDVVVGIANCGIYPAFEVSSNLGCEMDTIRISHYYQNKPLVLCDVHDPTFFVLPAFGYLRRKVVKKSNPVLIRDTKSKSFEGKNVLIVDDDTGSGITMEMAKEILKGKNPQNVKTAVLFKVGDYEPDFFARERYIKKFIYPWKKTSPYYEEYLQKMSEFGLSSIISSMNS